MRTFVFVCACVGVYVRVCVGACVYVCVSIRANAIGEEYSTVSTKHVYYMKCVG